MGEFAQVCAMQFWRRIFTALSSIPIPTPSLVPGSVKDLGIKIRRASESATLGLQLKSSR